MLANAALAALNGQRLLAPAALLSNLVSALYPSLVKEFRAPLEAPRVEVRGTVMAFLQLLVPFVREGID